ncbi:MAG: WbqC family protein [Bacteroidota bacterium]
MKLAINQPYFFPYVGYFSLIASSDHFIIFDTAQYVRHSWMNRNRILKPDGKNWQYITLPVKKYDRYAAVRDIEVRDDRWKKRLLGQLAHYKKKAPFYSEVMAFLEESLRFETHSLSDINTILIVQICAFLSIPCQVKLYSKMQLEHPKPELPSEWALYISKGMKAKMYINLPGGRELFERRRFDDLDIDLRYIKADLSDYRMRKENEFIPALSILDVLMFAGAEGAKKLAENYRLEK